jgi:hypothetical protein
VINVGGTLGVGGTAAILTTSSLELNDSASDLVTINNFNPGSGIGLPLPGFSQVIVTGGPVTISPTATLNFYVSPSYVPQYGDSFDLIAGASGVSGSFANLPEGGRITPVAGVTFQITYVGGLDANDVVLTYVPATTTTLTSSVNPTVYGESTTLTATVTTAANVTPTGTVEFFDGSIDLGPGTLDSGVATIDVSCLTPGSHSITAVYAGDANVNASTSSPITQTVALASASASVTSPGSTVYGQTVTLTAQLSAVSPGSGTPSGIVMFEDGTTALGTGTLDPLGMASYTTSSLSVGSHQITVTYGGDNHFLSTTSTAYSQVVNRASQTTTLVSSVNPTVHGQSTTLTATVTATLPGAGAPTGLVIFEDGALALGTGQLDATGTATFSTSDLSSGLHQITAFYFGDANFTPGTSLPTDQAVNPADTSLSLVASANPSVFGQSITYTVTASAISPGSGTPTQSVELTIDSALVATITLTDGTGSYTTGPLSVGSHDVVATLASDSDFNGSTGTLTQVVNQAATTVTTTTSTATSVHGQNVVITAKVNSVLPGFGMPSGVVQFFDGTTLIGTAALVPELVPTGIVVGPMFPVPGFSTATFSTSDLGVGSHTIDVVYGGDTDFTGSAGTDNQAVSRASTAIPAVSDDRGSPSTYGQTTSFTFAVMPVSPGAGAPTGTVTISDNGTPLANLPYTPVDGSMSYQTPILNAGYHLITVTYAGDGNFLGTSGSTTHTVLAAGTYTLLSSSSPTALYGQQVTYTANVSAFPAGVVTPHDAITPFDAASLGTPSGTITFYDGGTLLGASTLVGGQAQITVPVAGVGGTHNIQAVFSPTDPNFGNNSSAILPQNVVKADSTVQLYLQKFPSGRGYPTTVIATSPGGGVPTGSISFYVNGRLYGIQNLFQGMVRGYYFTPSSIRGKTISVTYSGDGNFRPSTSSTPIIVPATYSTHVVKPVSMHHKPVQVFHARAARGPKHR